MTGTTLWDSAIVLGGGFAGLLSARVLSDHFRQVTIVEQDSEPGAEPRPGVPQSAHPHALTARGASQVEEFFPGLRAELLAEGCPVIDFAEGVRILFPTGWTSREPVDVDVQLMPRPLLEHAIRRRVTALDAVTIHYGLRVDRVQLDRETGVTAVVAHPHKTAGAGDQERVLQADLVVDATGRGSRLPHWLAEAGFGQPATLVAGKKTTHTSRLYTVSPDSGRDWCASYEPTIAPVSPRGGVLLRIGTDQWIVGMLGAAGEAPPTDEEGFRAYARELRNPNFATIIDEGVPLGPIRRTRATGNRWYRYDRIRHWPARVIALGDSICIFNPVYGQGMTVAALQAALLDTLLTRHAERGNLDKLGRAFQRGAAALIRSPWMVSTSTDRAWEDNPTLSSRIAASLFGAVTARLPHHPGLYRRFVRTMQMLDPPTSLVAPRALAQIASLPSVSRHLATCTCAEPRQNGQAPASPGRNNPMSTSG
ncbi:NAD(P)/FAD-dependent oxidoreductase [Streptomyces sp. NPDC006285]|uniref:NAD(P)/FAD-dependent oxidoreductase n=1 Tax=Streptomyces sp. NPDC006285 TaxID=3364742 RepID=UPI003698A099